MPNLYTHQSGNIMKTYALMAGFLVLVVAIFWVFSQAMGDSTILYFGIILALAMNVGSYWWSDKLVMAMTRAKEADSNEYRELHRLVENLAITAGLPKPRVYVMAEPQPNAFATGRDPKHAAVAVTTGLMKILDRSELEGVLAHELSHIGNRDMLVSTVAVVLAGFIAIVSDMFMRSLWFGNRRSSNNSRSGGNQLMLVLAVVAAILAPIAASLLHLAVSRKREFLADASGAMLTRYPDGLASALKKISGYPADMKHVSHATAHLFLANPYRGKKAVGWFAKLFSPPPPIEERIKALMG